MNASIRVNSLTLGGTGHKSLGGMEKHGKRQDRPSQMRCVRDADPLVYGTLNLRKAYAQHMAKVRTNTGLKRPVLHALVKFPGDLPINSKTERAMVKIAIAFINSTHGGNAVFAARLDRDEEGRHNVDVFYSPKYVKVTKTRKGEEVRTWWMSTSKHGKILCHKHRAEIESRNEWGKFSTSPRQVGIALQAELYEYFGSIGFDLKPRFPKNDPRPDRLETDAYKAAKDAALESKAGELLQEIDVTAERLEDMSEIEGVSAPSLGS